MLYLHPYTVTVTVTVPVLGGNSIPSVSQSHARPLPAMFNVRSIVLLVVSYVVIPRLTFLPQNVHSLLILFGPFVLPRIVDWFNTARATAHSVPVRPTPPRVKNALNMLFVAAVAAVALSLARFAPDNIFVATQSHIRTETSVLFARLRHLRPLDAADAALRAKFDMNGRNKLLYLAFGPDTLLNCAWCVTADGNDTPNYLLYSLPKIVTPHLLQLFVLGLATSSLVGGEGSRFRTHATVLGLATLIAEIWYMATYDVSANKRALFARDIDSAYWRVRFFRYIAFAAQDLAMAFVLWATSTNRWMAKPVSIAERLETVTRMSEETLNKMRALGLVTNSVNRDAGLRGLREEYWRTEGQVMAETVQEEQVMEQMNAAIGKMDFGSLQGRVGQVADGILQSLDGLRTSTGTAKDASDGGDGSDAPAAAIS
jgi:hypothetical protein